MNHVAPRENPCQASLLKLEHYKTPQAANRFVIRSCDMLPITRSWFLTSWSTTSILYSYQRLYYIYSNLYIEIDISYYDVFIQQLESEPGCLEPTASSCSSISLEGVLPISPYHHSSHSIVNLGCHIDVIDLKWSQCLARDFNDFMRFHEISVMPCLWILWWHQSIRASPVSLDIKIIKSTDIFTGSLWAKLATTRRYRSQLRKAHEIRSFRLFRSDSLNWSLICFERIDSSQFSLIQSVQVFKIRTVPRMCFFFRSDDRRSAPFPLRGWHRQSPVRRLLLSHIHMARWPECLREWLQYVDVCCILLHPSIIKRKQKEFRVVCRRLQARQPVSCKWIEDKPRNVSHASCSASVCHIYPA